MTASVVSQFVNLIWKLYVFYISRICTVWVLRGMYVKACLLGVVSSWGTIRPHRACVPGVVPADSLFHPAGPFWAAVSMQVSRHQTLDHTKQHQVGAETMRDPYRSLRQPRSSWLHPCQTQHQSLRSSRNTHTTISPNHLQHPFKNP